MKKINTIDWNDTAYWFNCFVIKLSKPEINDKNFKGYSDYFHEYIHYLQTISLPFMQSFFSDFAESLANLARKAEENGIENRPFQLASTPIQETNKKLFNHYFKIDPNSNKNVSTLSNFKRDKITIDGLDVYKYSVLVTDPDGNIFTYYLSAVDLLENMAANIEEKYFGEQPIGDLPYRIINKIVNQFYASLGLTNEQITKLIELSLYVLDPIDFFFLNLDRMKYQTKIPCDKKLYSLIYKNLVLWSPTPEFNKLKISAWTIKIRDRMKWNITNIFGEGIYTNEIINFNKQIDNAFKKRAHNPVFISEISNPVDDDYLYLFKNFSTPLILFENNHMFAADYGKNTISFVPAILETVQKGLYSTQPIGCALKGVCSEIDEEQLTKSFDPITLESSYSRKTDPNCDTDPFNKNLDCKCTFCDFIKARKIAHS